MCNTTRRIPLRPANGPEELPTSRAARLLGGLAIGGIGVALLIMIAASLARQDWMFPRLVMPAVGPPWELQSVHVSPGVVTVGLWAAALLALGGIAAGLLAASRGARPPVRLILAAAVITVAVLAVLPPAGSSDLLDYAA